MSWCFSAPYGLDDVPSQTVSFLKRAAVLGCVWLWPTLLLVPPPSAHPQPAAGASVLSAECGEQVSEGKHRSFRAPRKEERGMLFCGFGLIVPTGKMSLSLGSSKTSYTYRERGAESPWQGAQGLPSRLRSHAPAWTQLWFPQLISMTAASVYTSARRE